MQIRESVRVECIDAFFWFYYRNLRAVIAEIPPRVEV